MTERTVAEPTLRDPTFATLEPLEAPHPPPVADDLPEDRFINRETSWLDFNARVLALAEDADSPLLERAKFLAIFATNLDEFFMVRVAGLRRRQATGLAMRTADGLSVREQLAVIYDRTRELTARHTHVFTEEVAPALQAAGICILRWEQLPEEEQDRLHGYFREQVFPVLTPLAVDPAHPFPYISGLSLNLAVTVREPGSKVERFARVKVPDILPRMVPVDYTVTGPADPDHDRSEAAGRSGDQPAASATSEAGSASEPAADSPATATTEPAQGFLPLEELIAAHLGQLFPGLEIVERHLFRVTRNADVEVEEDEAEDLLQALERELSRRRFGPAVRLEVQEDIDPHVLDLLVRELEVRDNDVMRIGTLLDLSTLWALVDLDRPDLRDEPLPTVTSPPLRGEDPAIGADFFATLRERDVLVHHPYESFTTSVQRFIEQAAADPNVLAIKQTLYRTSGDSPVVDALIDAAEAGKQVVVLVEIKARFDEQANIKWARALERAGCHVAYGVVGLKTHCKTALVVRQERGQLRRYTHVGTGNYNPKTARLYEDLGLFTADPAVGADLTDLFNTLTGYSRQTAYRQLLVAPHQMRAGIVERIEAEADLARGGQSSGIRLKLNSLVDEQVIDALYRASRAGVPVECVVRGICALRPGVAGLSDTIRVRSILGRFLEHSRLFGFTGSDQWWMGSADMMHRNLDRRVETLVRVDDRSVQATLAGLLDLAMDPDTSAWELANDGSWTHHQGKCDYQIELARRAGGDG